MQKDFSARGVVIVGVTEASASDADAFRTEQFLPYPVLADAQPVFEAWGVKALWGSVVYLIGRDGMVLARGIDECRDELKTRLTESPASGS